MLNIQLALRMRPLHRSLSVESLYPILTGGQVSSYLVRSLHIHLILSSHDKLG